MCQRRGSAVSLFLAFAVAWLAPGTLLSAPPAGNVFVLLPSTRSVGAPPPVTNGLTVKIDLTSYAGAGYCPIKVTVNAATPLPGDRSFSVQFSVPDSKRSKVEVSTNLDLAAGKTATSTVLYVPLLVDFDVLRFDIWEDGEHLADLSDDVALTAGGLSLQFLCPNSEGLKNLQPLSSWLNFTLLDRNSDSTSYSPYDLPESAIDYSPSSAVLVSIDELKFITTERAKAWKAMRQWVMSGGTLWVYGVKDKFARLSELEELLNLPSAPLLEPVEAVNEIPGWRRPSIDFNDENEDFIEARVPINRHFDPTYINDPVEKARLEKEEQDRIDALEKERTQLRTRLKEPFFVVRPLGMGNVAALHSSEPLEEHHIFWQTLSTEMHEGDNWFVRHGVSFHGNNPGFWNFLIPGVGLPPIVAFEVLITLFVIGIGPVNYLLLQRRHKQSWLIFTVPISAAIVTGCLLLYALIADGLGIRTRSRSFTEIDQVRGEAACWSRIAYYAGLQPSRGLEFALDAQVYPIEMFDEDGNERPDSARNVRKIEQGTTRRFTKGWLPARTVTQFLTVRARETSARLEVKPADKGSPPQVINHLGTRIQKLLVVAADGKCSWAEEISDGAMTQTVDILTVDGVANLRQAFVANALDFPPSWQDQRANSGLFNLGRGSRNAYRSSGYSSSFGDSPGALLEDGLSRAAHNERPAPRTYVAIVDRSPEFELGLDHVDSETGYHVIFGHW